MNPSSSLAPIFCCWSVIVVLLFAVSTRTSAFGPALPSSSPSSCEQPRRRPWSVRLEAESVVRTSTDNMLDGQELETVVPAVADRSRVVVSTLALLEHVNLNVPSHEFAAPFYFRVLGCGLDPRKAANLNTSRGTIWANCGASQFHLPHAETAQRIPGKIGLRFREVAWQAFQRRVQTECAKSTGCCFKAAATGTDRDGREFCQLTDHYDNVFLCRPDKTEDQSASAQRIVNRCKQPIIAPSDTETWGEVAVQYGREESDCAGIEFCEFKCHRGTAERIALFYDSVFDATASVVQDKGDMVAIVAFGNVDDIGKADQSLIFRETDDEIPAYDGHHVAMYVGESVADFEQAYRKCETAGVVWVNPRFSDKADTMTAAREWKQFRFKDIIDMATGETVFELEHEMRSIEHEAWPGKLL